MSLWKRIACNPEAEQRMKNYYDEKGLSDVRVCFAQWIEDRIMSERVSSPSTDLYEQIAHQFSEDLKQKLITLSNDNLMKFKLAEICTRVTQIPAVELYSCVRNGLQKELLLLEQMPQNAYMPNATPVGVGVGVSHGVGVVGVGLGSSSGMSFSGGGSGGGSFGAVTPMHTGEELYNAPPLLSKLGSDVERLRLAIHAFHGDYEVFHNYLNEYNQNKLQLSAQTIHESDMRLKEQYNVLVGQKNSIVHDTRRVIAEYDAMQESVINELKNWQRGQALAGNGAQFRDNLDEVQRCIEMLVEAVQKLISYVNMMVIIKLDDNVDLNELLSHLRCAQEVLVLSAFIVEKQPPQVMKTNTRFAAAVRWLIGPQLGINMNSPAVECIILSEAQAQRHSAQRSLGEPANGSQPASSGEIQNNVGTMEYQQNTRAFSASFRNMQLKKIKRAEKKGTESVMDEKFALLFYTSSVVNDYRIRVWTLSLPVVVIVHGNQEPQSWATITWDNAFSDIVREPFQVPEKVSWSQLSLALNTKFGSATGRLLTDENLNFLYEKLFRNDMPSGSDHKDYISWAQFCKEPLPDRTFTFWDWFFAIMKLTKDHLLGLWKAGLVVGFINKRKTTDEILRLTRTGTFLLRFSDSELGGITVAFVNEQGQVLMLSPWTARDLNIRGLADRVHDLPVLRYVYPTDMPRDEAFGEFYTQRIEEQTTRDGYVVNTIRAHVPAIEGGSLSNTPQHHMQSPHSQDMQMTNHFDMDVYLPGSPSVASNCDNFNISDFESIVLNY